MVHAVFPRRLHVYAGSIKFPGRRRFPLSLVTPCPLIVAATTCLGHCADAPRHPPEPFGFSAIAKKAVIVETANSAFPHLSEAISPNYQFHHSHIRLQLSLILSSDAAAFGSARIRRLLLPPIRWAARRGQITLPVCAECLWRHLI